MRIPISDEDKGVIWKSGKDDAGFAVEGTWFYEFGINHNYRQATYGEFKKLYPYDNGRGRYRSKIKTKYNQVYNKNL